MSIICEHARAERDNQTQEIGSTVGLAIKDLDALNDIHDSLYGTSTLLMGLTEYPGTESDTGAAIDVIADVLEANRTKLQNILRSLEEEEPTRNDGSDGRTGAG